MNWKNQILAVAKSKKIFRADDLEINPNSVRKYLSRLVDEGLLTRVGYGLYTLVDAEFSETQSTLEVAVKVPTAVLCLLSALRFHDLTTQNPFEVWIAIERGTRYPIVETAPTRIFRFAPKVYKAGIESHSIDGVEVKVYSPAKTIADCFYYQKTVGLDVALEALRDAWRQRKVTMEELFHFAEVRNVKSTMLPYLNSLS
jgi:predicted transcriptional regulator of viral defense system